MHCNSPSGDQKTRRNSITVAVIAIFITESLYCCTFNSKIEAPRLKRQPREHVLQLWLPFLKARWLSQTQPFHSSPDGRPVHSHSAGGFTLIKIAFPKQIPELIVTQPPSLPVDGPVFSRMITRSAIRQFRINRTNTFSQLDFPYLDR